MRQFVLTTPYITLGQLLKNEGIIDSGGQAKGFLRETDVHVNGIPESRRGCKLKEGDTVTIAEWGTIKIVGSS